MSGRVSCYDNAPVESFFSLLKRERIRWQTYPTREDTKTDVFDYIERSYINSGVMLIWDISVR